MSDTKGHGSHAARRANTAAIHAPGALMLRLVSCSG